MLIGFDGSRAFVPDATGTENYSLNILKALARVDRKNRYRVYLRNHNADSLHSFPSNFEFRLIRPSRLWTQVGLAIETWREPVDLLFVPAHTLPVLRNPRVKTVVTIHDLGVEYLAGYQQFPQRYYLDFASRYAARHAEGIIAVSAATKSDLLKRYGTSSKKIFVVHEGVDRAFFKPASKASVKSVVKKYKISDQYVLFVGTIQPRKNLAFLIEAFAKVGGSGDFQLVIAGKPGWNRDEILAAPKKFAVERRVKFIGRADNLDLPALYTGACVFAFPSLFEGFGLPILEAISCGCPVAAADIAPHREIVARLAIQDNFVPITLAKPKDIGGWVKILYQYISQYEKRSIFTTNKNLNLDMFSWEGAANGTLQVFEKTLS